MARGRRAARDDVAGEWRAIAAAAPAGADGEQTCPQAQQLNRVYMVLESSGSAGGGEAHETEQLPKAETAGPKISTRIFCIHRAWMLFIELLYLVVKERAAARPERFLIEKRERICHSDKPETISRRALVGPEGLSRSKDRITTTVKTLQRNRCAA